jgi:hypothetical protein
MNNRISAWIALALCLLATPVVAQPEERREEGERPRGATRERILRAFDRDGDGRLSQDEREAVREQLGERFDEIRRQVRELFEDRGDDATRDRGPRRPDSDQERPQRRRPDGDRPRERGPREPRGGGNWSGLIGPRPGAADRDMRPLFGWFDTDGDNMLNRREFDELAQFVLRHHPRPRGGPGGPRVGWRGPGRPERARFEEFRLERRRELNQRRDEDRDRRPRERERDVRRERDNGPRSERPDRDRDTRPAQSREAAYRTMEAT